MTENQRRRSAQLAPVGVQVGVTNSRRMHTHENFGVFGVVQLDFFDGQLADFAGERGFYFHDVIVLP